MSNAASHGGIAHHREKRSAQRGSDIEAAETDNSDPGFLQRDVEFIIAGLDCCGVVPFRKTWTMSLIVCDDPHR
jgi:hypothetical protein